MFCAGRIGFEKCRDLGKVKTMQETNPYQPSPSAGQLDAGMQAGGLSTSAIVHLAKTKPWVYFLGVVGIVIAVVLVLAGAGIIMGGAVFKTVGKNEFPFPMGVFISMGVGLAVLAVLLTVVSVKLLGFGSAISAVQSGGAMQDVERALDRQRGAWKFFSLTLLISILLYLELVGGVVATSYQSAKGRAARPPTRVEESTKGSQESGSVPVENNVEAAPDPAEAPSN